MKVAAGQRVYPPSWADFQPRRASARLQNLILSGFKIDIGC